MIDVKISGFTIRRVPLDLRGPMKKKMRSYVRGMDRWIGWISIWMYSRDRKMHDDG